MVPDFGFSYYFFVVIAAIYASPLFILSLASGIVCALVKRRVSAIYSVLIGAGIGLLGAILVVGWGFIALSISDESSVGDTAALAIFIAGYVAVSISSAACTWFIAVKSASDRPVTGIADTH